MRVFVSSSSEDLELVRDLQNALERRNIRTSSMLDVQPDESWSLKVEQTSVNADTVVFLLGPGASASP